MVNSRNISIFSPYLFPQYHGYQTYTAHAINKTVRDDFNGPTSRYPKARRVMILLTDGYADDAELVQKILSRNIIVFF